MFVKLFPSNITPIILSGFSSNFFAALAPLLFNLAWCLILYLFIDMRAVSDPEKNAESKNKITKIIISISVDILFNFSFR